MCTRAGAGGGIDNLRSGINPSVSQFALVEPGQHERSCQSEKINHRVIRSRFGTALHQGFFDVARKDEKYIREGVVAVIFGLGKQWFHNYLLAVLGKYLRVAEVPVCADCTMTRPLCKYFS